MVKRLSMMGCAMLAVACGAAVEPPDRATGERADALEIGYAVAHAPAVQAAERHWRCHVTESRRDDVSRPWQIAEYEVPATTTLGVGVALLDIGPSQMRPTTGCLLQLDTAAAAISLPGPTTCLGETFQYERGALWPESDVLRASLGYRYAVQGSQSMQGEAVQTFACTWID